MNIYNTEIEIAIPGRRPMPEDERASFVERLHEADLEDCYPLVWDDRNKIFPNTNGRGTVYVCPKCLKLQRHKAQGTYMAGN